ncbi:protein of unknown function [Actinacidiphila alni]|uniref:DUF397 domain-containing protein n=1 Tax=Actinacidiphila alni TaxID=380248 RepID=A0A1I2JAT0_9ACTN|nr:DUF397 domain-containing protein [Actinacidiphila alni]SFF51634.1 protein of unknown function [Actinacidiphila alni]
MSNADSLPVLAWRKSSYSSDNGGNCVEVAVNVPGHAPVRDSKDPQGPALIFSTAAWAAFITAVRSGKFPTS